jgi:hypothetical protein
MRCAGARTVERLAAATGQTVANASQHLYPAAGAAVASEKRGLYVTIVWRTKKSERSSCICEKPERPNRELRRA